jgi:hypothetical protein
MGARQQTVPRIDYAGRLFAPAEPVDVGTEPVDAAADPPIGHYHQDDDLVWAEFHGGSIRTGRLVGTVRPNGTIDAAYCLVTAKGEAIAGTCVSEPTVLADGRIRLTENWRRHDGSVGVSLIDELAR